MADIPTKADAARAAERVNPSFAVLIVLAVIIMGGILIGYDQGVISGALAGIQKQFGLSPLLTEVVTS